MGKHIRPDKPWEIFVVGLMICAGVGAFVYSILGMMGNVE